MSDDNEPLSVQILRGAREMLGPNGENWIKGFYSKKIPGRQEWGYCSIGAVNTVGAVRQASNEYRRESVEYDQATYYAHRALASAVYLITKGQYSEVQIYNDAPERQYPEIVKLFDTAIEIVEKTYV